jgi:hypothetical protein
MTYDSSGLEDLEDLAVNAIPCRGMDSGLDGVHCSIS